VLLLALGGNGGERAQRRGRDIPVGRNGEKVKRTERSDSLRKGRRGTKIECANP
jgi:hypothetical protein